MTSSRAPQPSPPPRQRLSSGARLALLAAVGVVVLGALVLAVARYQSSGIYAFDHSMLTPDDVGMPDVRVVRFRSGDGLEISAWLRAPAPERPLLISFFGGFTSVGASARRIAPLLADGQGLAMLVYRSSSGQPGQPSELAFEMDARALYDQLDDLIGQPVPASRRLLHGVSLGSSIAAGLARDREAAGLVLEAGFDRLCRWHSRRMFGLPMCLLMWRERHDVVDKLRDVELPKLVLHGERDDTIPIDWARDLFAELVGDKQFVAFPEGGHIDLMQQGAVEAIADFVAALPR